MFFFFFKVKNDQKYLLHFKAQLSFEMKDLAF